ncbi:MAG: helix-turn-helix domain-containing protein [Candidatus Methanoperedens sp.]|nr:helix-turn-helix domain-containing protein [Candidatus Methanoperedens sp.]
MTDNAAVASISTPPAPAINGAYKDLRHKLAEKMAGEITLSDNPGETLKKWRTLFEISQSDLAAFLKVSPSVISDYESGRRKSPGIFIVSKIVDAILDMDVARGGAKIRSYESILHGDFNADAIYDIHEYLSPISVEEMIRLIKGEVVYSPNSEYIKPLYGYTVIDSLKAILQLSYNEFQKLYGWSSERAMIFTNVSTGRSPMVALRVTNLKPALIVVHGLTASRIDPIAAKIAEIEHVPLITSVVPINDLVRALQSHDVKH